MFYSNWKLKTTLLNLTSLSWGPGQMHWVTDTGSTQTSILYLKSIVSDSHVRFPMWLDLSSCFAPSLLISSAWDIPAIGWCHQKARIILSGHCLCFQTANRWLLQGVDVLFPRLCFPTTTAVSHVLHYLKSPPQTAPLVSSPSSLSLVDANLDHCYMNPAAVHHSNKTPKDIKLLTSYLRRKSRGVL